MVVQAVAGDGGGRSKLLLAAAPARTRPRSVGRPAGRRSVGRVVCVQNAPSPRDPRDRYKIKFEDFNFVEDGTIGAKVPTDCNTDFTAQASDTDFGLI